ncbi:MAG: type II toxin-antitoxin system HicB family antitoxin [Thermoanaerobaculia bacterium]
MLTEYLRTAMRRAHYEMLAEDNLFYDEIPPLEGLWATGETLEACREELERTLEDWIFVRISRNLALPPIDGLELRKLQAV